MKEGCRRCGYCCVYLDVIIRRTDCKPNKFYAKLNDRWCPHLTLTDGIASCALHDLPDYSELATPCFTHNNKDEDPDIWCWGNKWRCIGPTLVAQKIYEKRPPTKVTWDELMDLGTEAEE